MTCRGSPSHDPRSSLDQRSRDPHKLERRDSERSRSRSRSPLRNGPDLKVDGLYGNNSHERPEVRIKEERKDDVMIIDSKERRPEPPKNDILARMEGGKNSMLPPGYGGLMPNAMLDHRLLGLYPPPAGGMGMPGVAMERAPQAHLWHPFDINHHRMEVQREMEREKEEMLRRFGVAPIREHERLREHQELLLRQQQQHRLVMEQQEREREGGGEPGKLPPPPLRPADLYIGALPPNNMCGPRTHSPLVNHNSKSNSPASTVGAPPPLISSGGGSSHSNSPSVIKAKAASPLTNSTPEHSNHLENTQVGATNGHDTQLQSR